MVKERGITLVSLVVTIIVLIILTGVSINLTLGENGIITTAKQAKENIELAKIEEETTLNELYTQIEIGGTEDFSYDALVKIQELNDKIASLEAEITELNGKVSTLTAEKKELQNQIESKNTEIVNLQNQIEILENDKTANELRIQELEEELASKNSEITSLNSQISTKDTTIKNLQDEITSKNTEISNLNKQITEQQANIQELQNQIDSLNATLSQTTATADKILKDYKAYSNGKLLTGTMANNGAVTKSLNAGESYTIAAGYHNGSGKVTANSLASQTQATATAEDIVEGKTAYVNGELIEGLLNSSKQKNSIELSPSMGTNIGGANGYRTSITIPLSSISQDTKIYFKKGSCGYSLSIKFVKDNLSYKYVSSYYQSVDNFVLTDDYVEATKLEEALLNVSDEYIYLDIEQSTGDSYPICGYYMKIEW